MSRSVPESAPPFDYTVTRTRRRTLAIHIRHGQVDVRAPLDAPREWVQDFVREKTPWIKRKLAQQQEMLRQRLVIADNRQVCFFGRPRSIRVVTGPRTKVEINDEALFIYTRENTPGRLERIFHRWLRERAREYMVPQTLRIARRLDAEDRLKDVVFRKTRSKWGHCKQDGTIQYNWLTMMAPREVVDYLITHECSHLLHMNHSRAFWRTVAGVCPDYQRLRGWLHKHGHRLWTTQ